MSHRSPPDPPDLPDLSDPRRRDVTIRSTEKGVTQAAIGVVLRCQSRRTLKAMGTTLTVRLTEELAKALRDEARQTGVSKGEIARQAIAARLLKTASRSVMSRYFGVMRGPADLSISKAYRRAWNQ